MSAEYIADQIDRYHAAEWGNKAYIYDCVDEKRTYYRTLARAQQVAFEKNEADGGWVTYSPAEVVQTEFATGWRVFIVNRRTAETIAQSGLASTAQGAISSARRLVQFNLIGE